MTWLLLGFVLLFAHTMETALGFGATLIALALGVHLLPLEELLGILVLLALVQSTWLATRFYRNIAWRTLGLLILPAAAVGTGLGMLSRGLAPTGTLQLVLGAFISFVSLVELIRMRQSAAAPPPLRRLLGYPVLLSGGVFQGLFASGGPLIVYYASRTLDSPASFRATLAILWLVLNVALLLQLVWTGMVNLNTTVATALLLPAALLGIALGSRLRPSERAFRLLIYSLLLAAGLLLAIG